MASVRVRRFWVTLLIFGVANVGATLVGDLAAAVGLVKGVGEHVLDLLLAAAATVSALSVFVLEPSEREYEEHLGALRISAWLGAGLAVVIGLLISVAASGYLGLREADTYGRQLRAQLQSPRTSPQAHANLHAAAAATEARLASRQQLVLVFCGLAVFAALSGGLLFAWALVRSWKQLQRSQARYRAIVEDQTELIGRFRRDGSLSFANRAFREFYGLGQGGLPAGRFRREVEPADLEIVESKMARVWMSGEPVRYWHRVPLGRPVWLQWTERRLGEPEDPDAEVQAVGLDVTDRQEVLVRRTQAELAARRFGEELRALAARLHARGEQERAAVARALHGTLGQRLTVVCFGLRRLLKALPADAALGEEHRTLIAETEGALKDTRELAARLRPSSLDLGLSAALESEAARLRALSGFHCELSLATEASDLSADAATALFRVAQEWLESVADRSASREATLSVRVASGKLILEAVCGPSAEAGPPASGVDELGALAMRERLLPFSGVVRAGGDRLVVELPYDEGGGGRG